MTAPRLSADISWHTGNDEGSARFELLDGVTALLGRSGAGKTTLARVLAGLHPATGGTLAMDGRDLMPVPPEARGIGLVPQAPALFPHLTVGANIDFAKAPQPDWRNELIEGLGLLPLMSRQPHQLSGGEARRVAIARALMASPKLLILDEPTNGLDPARRRDMLGLVTRIAALTETPVLLISHEREDMIAAAGHALLMEGQHLVASGSVTDILDRFDALA